MKATLKILVPLLVLAGVVFGLTFVSQYTRAPDEVAQKPGTASGTNDEPPLRFFSDELHFDPQSDNLAKRHFAGYFEAGTDGHGAEFWFENRNPSPVFLQLKHVSCTACSAGAMAAVPNEALRHLFRMHAVPPLPFGLVPVAGFGPALGGAELLATMKAGPWQEKKFRDEPNARFEVPAAPPGGSQWGVLRLNFQARPPVEARTLKGEFVAQVADDPGRAKTLRFAVSFHVTTPFQVSPAQVELGEMTEETEPRTLDVMAVSTTRDPADFPPPAVEVRDGTAKPVPAGERFVVLGAPALLTEAELARLNAPGGDGQQTAKYRTAYRIPVTIGLKGGAESVDIGPVERAIWVAGPGAEPRHVPIKATVKGSIWLTDGGAMDLGHFPGLSKFEKRFTVHVERAGTELAWVEDQTRPGLKVRLVKQPDSGDRGVYHVFVEVPPNLVSGPLTDGVVVLEAKGPSPRRIRIPVKGFGDLRK